MAFEFGTSVIEEDRLIADLKLFLNDGILADVALINLVTHFHHELARKEQILHAVMNRHPIADPSK